MFLGETGKEKIESRESPSWWAGKQGEIYESHPCLVLGGDHDQFYLYHLAQDHPGKHNL